MEGVSTHRAALAAAGAALLWSTGGLFIKLAPMPALAVVAGRALATGVFFLLAVRPRLRDARWSTAACYAGMIITFVSATKMTTAANAIFLQYTGPAYVLGLSPWLLREPVRRADVLAVLLSLGGMSLILLEGGGSGATRLGDWVGFLSGVFFGLTMVLMRRDAREGRVMASTTLGNLLAAAVALPLALPDVPAALSTRGMLVLLYLGVVQMGVGYLVFNRALRRLSASSASVLTMLEPVMNPVWVYLGLGERPGTGALVGGAIVIGTVTVRALFGR